MHILRDCESSLELWEKIVKPDHWHKFASLGLSKWLQFNLQDTSVGVEDWHWPMVFSSLVHMLWIDRNHFVFSGKSSILDLIFPKLFAQVDLLQNNLTGSGSGFMEASRVVHVNWVAPPDGSFKLNTDGSHSQGLSACGGLVRDSMGQFVRGFHCNLGATTSVSAELWGLVLGLRMARSLGILSLLVELDSKGVVNMVQLRRTHCVHLQPLLEEACDLMYAADRSCSITHVFREANFCADILAGMGHGGSFPWTLLEERPHQLRLALATDARSVPFVRLLS